MTTLTRSKDDLDFIWKYTVPIHKKLDGFARLVLVRHDQEAKWTKIIELTEADFSVLLAQAKAKEARAKFTREGRARLKSRRR
jgi:hypothetical protein